MAKRSYVKDLASVKKINKELANEAHLLNQMDASGKDLVASINLMAKGLEKSKKHSKEQKDLAKSQADLGNAMIGVIKAQDSGNKKLIAAAKAKLKIAEKNIKAGDKLSKKLMEQFKTQQKTSKVSRRINQFHKKVLKNKIAENKAAEAGNALMGDTGQQLVDFIKNPMTAVVTLFKMFSDLTDQVGQKFGAIGVTKYRDDLAQANIEFTKMGLKSEDLMQSIDALGNEFGTGTERAMEMSNAVGDVSKSLGLSIDESAKLVGFFEQSSELTENGAKNLLKQTASLAEANGVAPQAVLKDMAANTEVFAKFSAAGADGLARAAIQARKLGIDISKVAGSMEGMLDFQSSLNAETEASIMLGRNINLQKARELALAGDAEEFQKEMLNLLGSEEEWNNLNVLQKQSLAKALNMDIASMDKMVKKEKEAVTLSGEMAKQDLSKIIPEKSMSEMAKTFTEIKADLLMLAEELGPEILVLFKEIKEPVMNIFKSFVGWVKKINEGIGFARLFKGIAIAMFAKAAGNLALQVGIAYAKGAGSLGPGAIAALTLMPGIVGGIVASMMSGAKAASSSAKLAAGGIVTATPGGINATIGEGGKDEAVVPLDSNTGDKLGTRGDDIYDVLYATQQDIITLTNQNKALLELMTKGFGPDMMVPKWIGYEVARRDNSFMGNQLGVLEQPPAGM